MTDSAPHLNELIFSINIRWLNHRHMNRWRYTLSTLPNLKLSVACLSLSLTNIIRKVTYLSACGSRIDAQMCRNIDNSFLSMTTVRSVNFFFLDLFTKPRRELIHETVYRFTSCNLISFCVVHLIRFVKTTANWPFHSEIVFPINTFVFSVWRKPQHSQIHLTNRLNWHQFIVTHNNNKNTRNNTEIERKPHTVVECFANQWQYYVAHSKKIYCFYSVYSRFHFVYGTIFTSLILLKRFRFL